MGIDVNLYAIGDVTDEQLAAASAYMEARSSAVDTFGGKYPAVGRTSYLDDGRVEVSTLDRYYGPCYERGDWPRIYGAIRLLQTALPHCRVFYGGDSTDDGEECTPEFLAEMWDHFLGPNGDDYRTEMRAWNATQSLSSRG